MPYFPNTESDRLAMLQAIGVASVDELFAMIPAELRMKRDLCVPPGMGELELTAHIAELAAETHRPAKRPASSAAAATTISFPPWSIWSPPAASFTPPTRPIRPRPARAACRRSSSIRRSSTQLTGMDVSNASMYDGGSAAAEAVLMAMHATGRNRVVTTASVHPEYRQILATYLANQGVEWSTLATPRERFPPSSSPRPSIQRRPACWSQHPNFFGCLEEVEQLAEIAHKDGALFIVAVDPISLGLLKRPGDYGADIVVAEGQSLGNPMAFGGPYLGMMACREQFLRRMPGRLVGQTVDRRGNRCWVLTLQTREQHIRREKATSNICTNQGPVRLARDGLSRR